MVSSRSDTSRSSRAVNAWSSVRRGQALRVQSSGEEPLDDVIVEVPSNPVPILEYGQALLVRSGLDQLPGQRGLVGERFGEVTVGGSEVGSS